VIGLRKELHREIPEADYPELVTINGCIAYFTEPGPGPPRAEP
jgi:hypothetical protein